MLLDSNNTFIHLSCQQYICEKYDIFEENNEIWLSFDSTHDTKDIECPDCHLRASEIHDTNSTVLKDIPLYAGMHQNIAVRYHRYRCNNCGNNFTEDICFKEDVARLTKIAAQWIRGLLKYGLSISSISTLTGIHWDTIKTLHRQDMEHELSLVDEYMKESGYRPRYLAVNELSIHKGHTYATCVLDIEGGYVLWVGKGRIIESFRKFFTDTEPELLSEVRAVAMDMNASYN